jgi:hypothetical protein
MTGWGRIGEGGEGRGREWMGRGKRVIGREKMDYSTGKGGK